MKSNLLSQNTDDSFTDLKYQDKSFKEIFMQKIKILLIMILIMVVCTLISREFHQIKMFESNIVMVYLLGIVVFSYLAEGYGYSIFSSICAVLLYNFFFTEPYYTFKVNNPDYIITFFIMFFVGFITSMLTLRVKTERQQVEDREKYISSLYNIGKKLLDVKNEEDLSEISAEELACQLNGNVLVRFYTISGEELCYSIKGEDVFQGKDDQSACLETYESGSDCGHGTTLFPGAKAYYKAIISRSGVLGVIGVSFKNDYNILEGQNTFIHVVMSQISVVLDRMRISEKQKRIQMEMQKERLRADMLRSISHDFRTPLAGIMGLTSTAIDNYDKISDEVRKNFLQSIYDDADWLNELVENILQTTRFEEGKARLKVEEEAAEEIITAAVTYVKKHARKYNIHVNIPDEIILINVDGILIRQIIINLLNNAINYSPNGSDIAVSLYREKEKVVFEVKDNGPGILQEEMEHVFDRYYKGNSRNTSNRKGMGLGLSLCKSIVEAHGGRIHIHNYEPHGTIVDFYVISQKE